MITFTIDLEDPTEEYTPDGRYIELTQNLLRMLKQYNCRATFFVVGQLARAAPALIQDIAKMGHEVAYHSHAHKALTEENPTIFFEQTRDDKDRLQQLSQQPIVGYRAPRFSLTKKSLWAIDALKKLDFIYSSSVMPTSLSLFGMNNCPITPFLWPNGIIEIPMPVARIGNFYVPFLGGIYLYAPPFALTKFWLQRAHPNQLLWTYSHPYDYDRMEAFKSMPHTPTWVSFVLWIARYQAQKKIEKLLKEPNALPLGERILDFKPLDTYS